MKPCKTLTRIFELSDGLVYGKSGLRIYNPKKALTHC